MVQRETDRRGEWLEARLGPERPRGPSARFLDRITRPRLRPSARLANIRPSSAREEQPWKP